MPALPSRGRRLFVGLSFGHADPSAAVVEDGRVLGFIEEERLVRVKHADGRFPRQALAAVLAQAGAGPRDRIELGVNWNLAAYADGRMRRFYAACNARHGASPETLAWQAHTLATYDPAAVQAHVARQAQGLLPAAVRLRSFGHHFVHALQVAAHSPFDDALVLSLDGSGDSLCSTLWRWQGGRLRRLRALAMPHSLGWCYAAVTEYLGFRAYDGEQKVMAMAACGQPDGPQRAVIDRLLQVTATGYAVDARFLHQGAHTYSGRFTDAFAQALGALPRQPSEPWAQRHFDLAAAMQQRLEQAAIAFCAQAVQRSGAPALCLGGGVSLNVRLAGVLQRHFGLPVFTYPLAADGGACIGAALAACRQATRRPPQPLPTLALGPEPGEEATRAAVGERPTQPLAEALPALARCLAGGGLVAWVQGRMEGGARAIGHRSLFCDPAHAQAVNRVTTEVKARQPWQPYGVSVAAEEAGLYFEGPVVAEWMSIAAAVRPRFRAEAPLAVHRDGTTRPHLVHRARQPALAALLAAFRGHTGRGVLINTSLNRKGEPIVCTPQEALALFDATPVQALVLQDRVLWKR